MTVSINDTYFCFEYYNTDRAFVVLCLSLFRTLSSWSSGKAVTWNTNRPSRGGGEIYLQHHHQPVDCYCVAAEWYSNAYHLKDAWCPALHQP